MSSSRIRRRPNESTNIQIHVTIHTPPTRMVQDTNVTPQILFPDSQSFVATDVDFTSLFPALLPSFTTHLKRFICTRCRLSQVPTPLYTATTLTEVNLSGNALHDVPVQFEGSGITTLDLAKNDFTDVPVEIWAMPQLRTLDLSANRITSCKSPAINITATDGLRTLILDDNPLGEFTCRFTGLQTLSLYNTSISALPRVLSDFSNLTRLNLSGNPSLALAPMTTQSLISVTELDLSSNGLSSIPTELRILTPNLISLRVTKSHLTDDFSALAAVRFLPNLTTLILDDNKITNATAILTRFRTITRLSVAHNTVSELSSRVPLDSLQFLNLSGNTLKSFDIASRHIDTLDLSHNKLSSISTAIFAMSNLQTLDLSGNPIEPWALSQDQFTFLSGLKTLKIDQIAFASCAVENQRVLQGQLKVCLSQAKDGSPQITPSPSIPTNSTSSHRSSTSSQILYLGGSFLIAILIGIWIYAIRRRRQAKADQVEANSSSSAGQSLSVLRGHGNNLSSEEPSSDPSRLPYLMSDPSEELQQSPPTLLSVQYFTLGSSNETTFWEDEELQAWRVDFNDLNTHTKLATGTFTEVWRASYRTDTVAVKKLKSSIRVLHLHHPEMVETGVLEDFIFEIRVLSRLNHPRIVAFYGAAWTSESELAAIMEYMPQQDLREFLNARQQSQHYSSPGNRHGESTWSIELVHIALCVAEALTYLHAQEPPLIHGNVQAKNVLLDDHMDSKLCDFGSAQYCTVPVLSLSDQRLTNEVSDGASSSFSLASVRADATPWIPPEVLRSQAVVDPSIDMYAFGVLLSEMDTNTVPYDHGDVASLNDLEIRRQVAVGSLRPRFTVSCPLSILALAMRCLAYEPSDRPTSTDVTFALREILADMEQQSRASIASLPDRSTIAPLVHLPSNDSTMSDSDMSQRTIDFRRYSST